MVSEDSCISTNKPYSNHSQIENSNAWLSNGISKMSDKTDLRIEDGNLLDKDKNKTEDYIRDLLVGISDRAVDIAESSVVMTRNRRLSIQEKQLRRSNRQTSVVEEDFSNLEIVDCRNNFVNLKRRALSDCAVDENYNRDFVKVVQNDISKVASDSTKNISKETNDKKGKEKKKRILSFNSLFGKKDKHKAKDNKEEEETQDNITQLPVFPNNSLGKSKKYASALELRQHQQKDLHRKPSFIKKLVHIREDSSNFLKRSLSFREHKKTDKGFSKEKLTEIKNQEWKQSLQSLVETDTSVSYNDLSFVNYDPLNDINYESGQLRPGKSEGGYIGRTQSMIEKVSCFF